MADTQPLVSVIVPCYNYGRFLGDALESIRTQSLAAWECIIVDDGSTDNSSVIANAFCERDARFRLISKVNGGLSAARNTGLDAARGRYVQLLDADDAIAPRKLEVQSAYLDANADADLVFGDTEYFTDDPRQRTRSRTDIAVPGAILRVDSCGPRLLRELVRDNFITVSAPLYRAATGRNVGAFAVDLKSYEDWQYWFRFALAGACFHYRPVPETATWIRYSHTSMMGNRLQMKTAGIRIRRFFSTYLSGTPAIYNQYRLLRLRVSKLMLRITG